MKIVWVSCYCSDRTFSSLFEKLICKPEVSIQNYMSLFLAGFNKNNVDIACVSERQIFNNEKKKVWLGYKEIDSNCKEIIYLPTITIPVLSQLFRFLYNLFFFLCYFIKNRRPNIIVCDVMRFYASFPALLIAKLMRIRCVGYAADIPQMYHHQKKEQQSFIKVLLKKIYSFTSVYYDGYIILSEYMNEHINPKGHPYIVVEGLVPKIGDEQALLLEKSSSNEELILMYSGGLYEKYGVKMLLDAVAGMEDVCVKLWLFGKGELVDYIEELDAPNIVYYGYKAHYEVVAKQRQADFLINPRFTNEEYTKYSFPSKTMEYLASGTPVISTRIKGIPNEYFKYIIPIEEESIKGIQDLLKEVSSMPKESLIKLGNDSKRFVYNEKNNVIQTARVVKWMNQF